VSVTAKQRDDLLIYLFGDAAAPLAVTCGAWMAVEPRFAAFLDRHRDKIRKKARLAEDVERARDLLAELEIAHALLEQPRFELGYETYAAGKTRGPDFTVIYRGHVRFNVEVKRLRPASRAALASRLTDAVCAKLRQMPASTVNVLAVVASDPPDDAQLATLLRTLVAEAEVRNPAFLARHGYDSPRDFFTGFHRLSAVFVRAPVADGDASRGSLWSNPQARHVLPPEVRTLLSR
jgi:hypothetical protein